MAYDMYQAWREDQSKAFQDRQDVIREKDRADAATLFNRQKEIAQMQYGIGGAVDRDIAGKERIAGLQYGPGGAYDRHGEVQTGIAKMQAPVWEGQGEAYKATARATNYKTDLESYLAGMTDKEGNSLLGLRKAFEYASPFFAGGNVPYPSSSSALARPNNQDVISSIWEKEAMSAPYVRATLPERGFGSSSLNPANWLKSIQRGLSGASVAYPSY